jgi:hypothetical protein
VCRSLLPAQPFRVHWQLDQTDTRIGDFAFDFRIVNGQKLIASKPRQAAEVGKI